MFHSSCEWLIEIMKIGTEYPQSSNRVCLMHRAENDRRAGEVLGSWYLYHVVAQIMATMFGFLNVFCSFGCLFFFTSTAVSKFDLSLKTTAALLEDESEILTDRQIEE